MIHRHRRGHKMSRKITHTQWLRVRPLGRIRPNHRAWTLPLLWSRAPHALISGEGSVGNARYQRRRRPWFAGHRPLLCRNFIAQKLSNSDYDPYLFYVHHVENIAKLRKGMSRDTIGKKLVLHNPEFWDNSTIPTYRSSATWPKSGTNSPTFAKLCATTFVKSPCFHRGDQTCCGTVLQNWDNLSHPPPARASESCTIPTWLFLAPSSNG